MFYKLLVPLSFLLLTGCATVREVKTQPGKGGVIAVKEGMVGETAKEKYERIMRDACPRGFMITEKGEEVVGSKTTHSAKSDTKGKGESKGIINAISATESSTATSGESEKMNTTEWRITYKCKAAKGKKAAAQ